LGGSGLMVSPVALGCWPIAGVTTLDTNDVDSIATIRACLDLGVNHLDTAYVYGPNGESENLICRARLGTDRIELLYLHSPDEKVPIEDSAGALRELMSAGKTRSIGASNCTVEQLETFAAVCPLAAVQMPYNMLQRDIETRTIPWCRERGIAVMVYWPLMKGLLAGRLARNHQFASRDGRQRYPMYQGDEWQQNQDFVGRLREAATLSGHTVAQLVINWMISQPGITAALCGAKRQWQIEELAGAIGWALSDEQRALIEAAMAARGSAAAKRLFT
jgi:aryl-alcohol dehydrogenase-like predicted oxidoreductase